MTPTTNPTQDKGGEDGLGKCPATPELEARLRASVEAHNSLPPLERAIHDLEQKRSFIHGQMPHTADRSVTDKILDGKPEYVLLAAYRTLTEETAHLKERVRETETILAQIRAVIPMDFLIAHDTPGATGPTAALDLVGAVRSLVHNARKWEARVRSALHTTPEVGE